MAISLQKGGNVNLSKEAPGMKKMLVGLGWDVRATDGDGFDLDASAFLLNEAGKVRGDADFIFYNQAKSTDGSVEHTGDNRTGAGDGDDESIIVEPLQGSCRNPQDCGLRDHSRRDCAETELRHGQLGLCPLRQCRRQR